MASRSIDTLPAFRKVEAETTILSRDYLTMKPLLDWLKSVGSQYAGGVLVDYGCGNKPYYGVFAKKVEKYIGVDVSQNAFNSVDVVLNHGDILPFQNASIDTVLSTQVLEHASEPEKYLKEVARILRPGGYLVLSCPGSYMLHEEPHDYYRYTRYGMIHLLTKSNLRIIRIDTAGGAWRLIGQIFLNHKTFGRRIKIPIVSGVIYHLWILAANIVFSALDMVNKNEKDTANYMLIARKG